MSDGPDRPKPLCRLIGAGKAGSALARALSRVGYRFAWIGSRTIADAERLADELYCSSYSDGYDGFTGGGVLFLAVPDDAVASVAEEVAATGAVSHGTVAAHLSGALGVDVLQPLSEQGASVMAFHPAQAIPEDADSSTLFREVYFDMEGDTTACMMGSRIARDLGAEAVQLSHEARVLAHCGMAMLSNYTVTVAECAFEALEAAGIDHDTAAAMLTPLLRTTAANIERAGPMAALTGPASRGDGGIILRHLAALEQSVPELVPIYRELACKAAAMGRARGESTRGKYKQLLSLLEKYTNKEDT